MLTKTPGAHDHSSTKVRARDRTHLAMSRYRLQLIHQHLQGTQEMSGSSDTLLSTHVLNTAQGIPARGLTITLSKLDTSHTKWVQLSRSVTNEDGRCPGLLRGEPLTAGTFQLRFDTKDYWTKMQQESFYPYVEVVFTITDPKQKYHVPLLLSPFSYSTYRGS